MTIAASRADFTSGILSRREIALWLVVAALANEGLHALDLRSPGSVAMSLASQNLIYWFSCFALISILWRVDADLRTRPIDVCVAIVTCTGLIGASLVGYRFGVGVLATGLSVYLLCLGGGRAFRAAGCVMLALSVHLTWAPIIFQYLLPWILRLDMLAVSAFLALIGSLATVENTSIHGADGHSAALVGGCSAFQNLSIAMLAYVSAAMLLRGRWVRGDLLWLLATCLALIVINTVRLAMLGMNRDLYAFWHDGAGVPILALGETAVIAALSLAGASRGRGRA